MKIIAVGDILLAKKVEERIKNGNLISREILTLFKQTDLRIGNLELPFSIKKMPKNKYKVTHPIKFKNASVLKELQFDVLTLANNHILDWGREGLETTINILNKQKIFYCGAGFSEAEARNPAIISKKGIKVAVLGYVKNREVSIKNNGFGPAFIDLEDIRTDISKIKPKVDLIIVNLHWGVEFNNYPSPEDIKLAHKIIDCGADIILGHHPHVIQKIEKYDNKIIAYSLGNFISDPSFCNPFNKDLQCESIILEIDVYNRSVINYIYHPIIIEPHGFIRFANSYEAEKIRKTLIEISKDENIGNFYKNLEKLLKNRIKILITYLKNRQFRELILNVKSIKFKHLLYLVNVIVNKYFKYKYQFK